MFLGIHNKSYLKIKTAPIFKQLLLYHNTRKKDWTYTDIGNLERKSHIKQAKPFELKRQSQHTELQLQNPKELITFMEVITVRLASHTCSVRHNEEFLKLSR